MSGETDLSTMSFIERYENQIIYGAVILFLVVVFFYWFRFSNLSVFQVDSINEFVSLFGDAEAFGQFGDFVGGLLNPLLAFLSFFILIKTNVSQSKVVRESFASQQKSLDLQRENLDLDKEAWRLERLEREAGQSSIEKEKNINHVLSLIDDSFERLDKACEVRQFPFVAQNVDGYKSMNEILMIMGVDNKSSADKDALNRALRMIEQFYALKRDGLKILPHLHFVNDIYYLWQFSSVLLEKLAVHTKDPSYAGYYILLLELRGKRLVSAGMLAENFYRERLRKINSEFGLEFSELT